MRIQGLQILVEELVEKGFLLETRIPVSRRVGRDTAIEVGNTSPLDGETSYTENSTSYYLETVRQGRFSWLLFDGSIVQVLYHLRGDQIVFHRYCYIPAPFEVDLRSSVSLELEEWIQGASNSDPLNTSRRSSLRFEYDPAAQAEGHAAAHLHLNSPECRIPMRGPLSVRDFISFLVNFLYSKDFPSNLCGVAAFDHAPTITNIEERNFHINWRRLIPAV